MGQAYPKLFLWPPRQGAGGEASRASACTDSSLTSSCSVSLAVLHKAHHRLSIYLLLCVVSALQPHGQHAVLPFHRVGNC